MAVTSDKSARYEWQRRDGRVRLLRKITGVREF